MILILGVVARGLGTAILRGDSEFVWSKVLPHLGCNDEGEEGSTPSQQVESVAQAESNLTQHLDSPTGGKTGISCDEMTSRLFDQQSFQIQLDGR